MKLASIKSGRDGALVIVSTDLTRKVSASEISLTLQQALDNWNVIYPALKDLSDRLESGEVAGDFFDELECCSPLPRAYQWADGSAYVNHVELVRRARNAKMPETFWIEPLMYQGCSHEFLPHHANINPTFVSHGLDFEAEVAIITNDVPMLTSKSESHHHIKLLMLINDIAKNIITLNKTMII